MNDLIENIEAVFYKVKNPKFLNDNRPGGDIPYFILPYKIELENEMDKQVSNLTKRLKNEGINVLSINLYNASIAILKGKNGLEKMFKVEKRKKKSYFLKALQSSLEIHQVFMPYINDKIEKEKPQVVFISGIAPVYPFIRSHVILNNLQSITGDIPMVMFYPGEYTGQNLKLFNRLEDDNYYRALHIMKYHI